ncbi:MAG: glycosyltransferase [Planctomycetota bacterium]
MLWNLDRAWNRYVRYPSLARRMANRFGFFHVVDHSYAHLVSALPAQRTGVYVHDLIPFEPILNPTLPKPWWHSMVFGPVWDGLRRAALLFCSTKAMWSRLGGLNLCPSTRIVHAPYGVCEEFRPGGQRETGAYLLHVGSCVARKRVDDLLRVFVEVRKHCPDLRLIQAGGTFTALQRSLISSMGISMAVEQRRNLTRDVLARLYRGARVVLMPSDNEGFGLPVIEALACGAPVVASDLPTLREAGGGVARHVPVGDIHGFAQATLAAMERHDPQAGLHHASRFTWANHAAIIHDAYSRLAAGE